MRYEKCAITPVDRSTWMFAKVKTRNTRLHDFMKHYLCTPIKVKRFSSIIGLLFSVLATFFSLVISYEKLQLALSSSYKTSCSFGPVVSCSPVMSSWQAGVFWGFPNPFIGIVGFSVLASFFFLSFFVRIPRWVFLLNTFGVLLALVFCFWLATQALFIIQAICVYCVAVWICTSVIFWLLLSTLFIGTDKEHLQAFLKIGLVLNLSAFVFMIFFAFQQYWLSLL